MRVIIIGAGLFGVSAAYFLAIRGIKVVVIDQAGGVARETSYANGGIVHAGNAAPWNKPGLPSHLLLRAGVGDPGLALRLRALPELIGWGWEFLRNCRFSRFRYSLQVNARLAAYSLGLLQGLRQSLDLHYQSGQGGALAIFRNEASLAQGQAEASLLAEEGIRCRRLNPQEAIAYEPTLNQVGANLAGGIYYPGDESGDAQLFTQELAERARRHGATFYFNTRVDRLLGTHREITGIATTQGVFHGDAYLLAAGSYSPGLARPLGLRLPIYPVKGYSMTFPVNGIREVPKVPLIDSHSRIVLTKLGERFRVAGFADLMSFDKTPDPKRIKDLRREFAKLLPSLFTQIHFEQAELWAGLRPMTSDGRPILGNCPVKRLYLATGGGHLGWTMATGAGRVIADLLTDRPLETELTGLTYARFESHD